MEYPYVVASLPMLNLGERPPFTTQEFLFKCEGALQAKDLRCLRRMLAGEAASCRQPFAQAWNRCETQLRLAIAHVRAGRLGVERPEDVAKYRTLDPDAQRVVVDAFAKTHPLERERVLDEYRWHLLNELAFQDAFGLATVLAFGLKLQIADRWADLGTDRGEKAFEEHAARIAEKRETVTA